MANWTSQSLYGMGSASPVMDPVGAAPTQTMMPVTGDFGDGYKSLVNPRNPLFWFGVVLVVTVGAAGVAGTVRVGPARVSGSVGKA